MSRIKDTIYRCKYYSTNWFFPKIFFVDDFRSSTKRRSIKLVDSNHIVKFREIQKGGQMFIEGFCIRQTSITAAPYHVQFELDF
ncbi:hypothetical protein PV328_008458 [Microctonus aethiopoides]|uniref:Uncharacterized protein n=1 Tax=Microctonus aethiopoides TaxID=144406 RepID=A0AA39FJK5_9HYME|nr:hypothetical protein PV328_008458 [Microctonus aethiopoides]